MAGELSDWMAVSGTGSAGREGLVNAQTNHTVIGTVDALARLGYTIKIPERGKPIFLVLRDGVGEIGIIRLEPDAQGIVLTRTGNPNPAYSALKEDLLRAAASTGSFKVMPVPLDLRDVTYGMFRYEPTANNHSQ